jgi:hypothetical protein
MFTTIIARPLSTYILCFFFFAIQYTWEFHLNFLLCISFWFISLYLWLTLIFLFSKVYYKFTPLWHGMSRYYTSRHYWKWYELFSNGKVVTYGYHDMIQMTCIHDIYQCHRCNAHACMNSHSTSWMIWVDMSYYTYIFVPCHVPWNFFTCLFDRYANCQNSKPLDETTKSWCSVKIKVAILPH